jgi:2-dehydro-3-deoxyphosphooctonate aldolase (KDO 8-P synthase)
MCQFNLNHIQFYPGNPLVLIAGPCVIESSDHVRMMARELKVLTEKLNMPFVFKASFMKANRSSIDAFVGPGPEEGLDILAAVKKEFELPILSDIHSIEQIKPAAKVLDIIQIPAFLCRQTDLIVATAETGIVVNVKKGQFLSPHDVKNIMGKVYSTGNKKLLITERGTSFGYNNLVVDMRGMEIIKNMHLPVIFDATHSVQLPGGQGDRSGGQREFVLPLSKAAVALGINALFMEVHDDPAVAKSDGPNMIPLDQLEKMLRILIKLDEVVKKDLVQISNMKS